MVFGRRCNNYLLPLDAASSAKKIGGNAHTIAAASA
jgi:hypothetical protein